MDQAKQESQIAYDKALMAKNMSQTALADLEKLIQDITEFLEAEGATPAMIRELANEVCNCLHSNSNVFCFMSAIRYSTFFNILI